MDNNKRAKFLKGFARAYMAIAFIGGIVYAINLARLTDSWLFFLVLIVFWLLIILIVILLTVNIQFIKFRTRKRIIISDSQELWQCACGYKNNGRSCGNCGEAR